MFLPFRVFSSVLIPGSLSGLRERLISNGGWGNKRRDSTAISLVYLKEEKPYTESIIRVKKSQVQVIIVMS